MDKTFTIREFDEALPLADKLMKESNGHFYEHMLKTRCIYCGRSPRDKRKCGAWFQCFIDRVRYVLVNGVGQVDQNNNGENGNK